MSGMAEHQRLCGPPKLFFAEAFRFVDTFGLPLETIMRRASEHGIAVDLRQFILDAICAGWPGTKAVAVANEAVRELRSQHCWFRL